MNSNYITPFISSIQNVFSTMLQLEVTIGDPRLKTSPEPTHDVSGIIGMTGDVRGSVTLSFEHDAAIAVVALFCGERLESNSADFADAVGELVNMVSGNAKAQFPENKRVSISCPNVIVGRGHTIATQSDTPCVIIPCSTDCGEVVIEVAIREDKPQAATPAQAAATA